EANFVLVLFEGALSALAAMEAIADAGYAVRHLPGQGLDQALRITVGTTGQMDAVAAAIRIAAEAAG
ncbi:MAG: histidinol-phosphate transaminase, partial [Tsuneonella sp.]